jgi:hypothetical protein
MNGNLASPIRQFKLTSTEQHLHSLTTTMHDRERDGEFSAYEDIAFRFARAALAIQH